MEANYEVQSLTSKRDLRCFSSNRDKKILRKLLVQSQGSMQVPWPSLSLDRRLAHHACTWHVTFPAWSACFQQYSTVNFHFLRVGRHRQATSRWGRACQKRRALKIVFISLRNGVIWYLEILGCEHSEHCQNWTRLFDSQWNFWNSLSPKSTVL